MIRYTTDEREKKSVILLKEYDGKLTYNYFDEMAQSYCASGRKGWVFALRRNCPKVGKSCKAICAGAKNKILASIRKQKRRCLLIFTMKCGSEPLQIFVSCFDAYLIVKGHSKLRDNPSNSQPDAGKVNLRTYGYGGTGCTYPGRSCGPNYCCCWAF
ncbi:unnamed protein product [Mytilus edulis]|uniref:Uncharacterized protein n=1 Tax=Mytilus edulis TaxID=6550 RepID=A0A8S3SQU0_MYTED|nr:unnamed protein product [Mytilus edulis]